MSKKRKKQNVQQRSAPSSFVGFLTSDEAYEILCSDKYKKLSNCPEIITGCLRVAELVASMTIKLMANTDKGDVRIINELSRKIDIDPCKYMTRKQWMTVVVMNLLLYGEGNSIIWPHTENGLLQDLETVAADRVSFMPIGRRDYKILIDGVPHDPEDLIHITHNPDKYYPYMGKGLTVSLRDVAERLAQAGATKNAFMKSKWKPPIVVKVDSLVDEFSSPEGRRRLLDQYISTSEAGEPWVVPAGTVDIKEVRPLTLQDLAIHEGVEIDKRTAAAIIGCPPWLLGVGEYNREEWNNFINTKIKSIAQEIEQKLTKGLIISPKWYLRFNIWSLLDYDIQTMASTFSELRKSGIVIGNEVRDRLYMEPLDGPGMNEPIMLENYIPADKLGDQKKLIQEE